MENLKVRVNNEIEKEMKMKEYLEKQADGSYELVLCYRKKGNDWIEVPEGAEMLVYFCGDSKSFFYKGDDEIFKCDQWIKTIGGWSVSNIKSGYAGEILWQRSETEKQADAWGNKPFSQCIPVLESAWDKQTVGMKYDNDKPRYSLLPKGAVNAVIDVLEFGAKKYEADNWQKVDNAKERYYNAAMRHIDKWWNGEKHDPETNIHHLAHAATNLFFLMWFDKK